MNDTKHDVEKIGESATRKGGKVARFLGKWLGKAVKGIYRFFLKHFANPMKAIDKDGSTKRKAVSPALTKEETKYVIAKAREEDVLVCVKEMEPSGEYGKGKSLHQQGKMAHAEIKQHKWKERSESLQKVPFLQKYCLEKAEKYRQLARKDNLTNKEKRYIIICNESRTAFMNDCMEQIHKKRMQTIGKNELEDINKDGIVDEKDMDLEILGMDIEPEQLKIGKDYGSCYVKDYYSNYCTQIITKDEYCDIRRDLFDFKSHGAYVMNEQDVLIAFPKDELSKYRQYCNSENPIREYGYLGAKEINSEQNHFDILSMEVENEAAMQVLREKYVGKDYLAVHNADGTVSVMVKESDTERMVDIAKKKSTTSDLLKEAKEFLEKDKANIDVSKSLDMAKDTIEDMEVSEIAR